MLDQNTDRMWYVIGAVIVGAAIILILNGTMPQLFASVADSFSSKTEHSTIVTDGIMPPTKPDGVNLIEVTDIKPFEVDHLDTSRYNTDGTVYLSTSKNMYSGIQLNTADLPLEPSTQYTMHFTYQKTNGTLVGFGGHDGGNTPGKSLFWNNTVYVDGEKQSVSFSDTQSVFVTNDSALHHVEVYFTTPSEEYFKKADVRGIWIQPNRLDTTPVSVKILDLKLEKGHSPTTWSPYGVVPEDVVAK